MNDLFLFARSSVRSFVELLYVFVRFGMSGVWYLILATILSVLLSLLFVLSKDAQCNTKESP